MKYLLVMFGLLLVQAVSADVGVDDGQVAADFFRNVFSDEDELEAAFRRHREDKQASEHDFSLDGEFGVLSTSGNTRTSLFKMALDAQHNMQDWVNEYSTRLLKRFTEINGITSDTHRFQISGEFDYKLVEGKNRLFLFTEYDDNQFLQLRDQMTAVLGWRHLAIDDDTTVFQYSIGPGYGHFRQQQSGVVQQGMILRTTADFQYKFTNDARFRQRFMAEVNDVATNISTITSVTAKIIEKLGLKLSFEMTFDENVAVDVQEFSTQTSVSLVYQFF